MSQKILGIGSFTEFYKVCCLHLKKHMKYSIKEFIFINFGGWKNWLGKKCPTFTCIYNVKSKESGYRNMEGGIQDPLVGCGQPVRPTTHYIDPLPRNMGTFQKLDSRCSLLNVVSDTTTEIQLFLLYKILISEFISQTLLFENKISNRKTIKIHKLYNVNLLFWCWALELICIYK